ncbi:MAG: hypothetical protein RMJ44_06045 [Cytophagales bacterium]|nr:hypothetical protein [Bernardetiaceae bacterium]MDW8210630.1 hypothetical protein [Cytophagales bacterium]
MRTVRVCIAMLFASIGMQLSTLAQEKFSKAGKIWYSDGFLYVNIVNEGVLVINNFDPRAPKKMGFIQIPGNVDMAVRGTVMYANAYQDLVALDISDLNHIKELKRIPSVFTHRPQSGFWNASPIAWRTGADLQEIIRNAFSWRRFWWESGSLIGNPFTLGTNPLVMSAAPVAKAPANAPTGVSKGGSMACFALVDDYLYAIDSQDLLIFSIKNPASPEPVGMKVHIGSDIETIFAYENHLFIGSQSGMYIYNIADRTRPERQGSYQHVRSCDPVVVEGNYAYVTLRNGTDCGGSVNQLDIIDISSPARPRKISTHAMTNPHGLGIDNGLLFICDGRDGLKVFDATNPRQLRMLAHFHHIQTYDVIPDSYRKVLMMVGGNKIAQYDYHNPQQLTQLSVIDLTSTADIEY